MIRDAQNGSLIPARIYGGDRASLLRELGRDALVAYVSGIAFILAVFWIFLRHFTVQAEKRPSSVSRAILSKSS
jgi:hypothetical protein